MDFDFNFTESDVNNPDAFIYKESLRSADPSINIQNNRPLNLNINDFVDDIMSNQTFSFTSPDSFNSSISSYHDSHFNTSSLINSSDSAEKHFPSFPLYMRIVYTSCCSLTFLIGVLGNILVPIVVSKERDLSSTSTGSFMINLAVADLLVLVVCNPSFIVELFSPPQIWVLPAALCKLVPFIEHLVEYASVLMILAISLERHHVICRPLRAASSCTRRRAALICVAIWPIAAAFASPTFYWTDLTMAKYLQPEAIVPVCLTRVDLLWPSIYMLSMNIIIYFLPLLLLLFLYSRIVRQLFMENKYICCHSSDANHRARKQVVTMLGSVVLSFFLCLLPYHLFSLWHFFTQDIHVLKREWYFNITFFSRMMIYINSSINPILYNLTSSKFRDRLFVLLRLRKRRCQSVGNSSYRPGQTLNMAMMSSTTNGTSRNFDRMIIRQHNNSLTSNQLHSTRIKLQNPNAIRTVIDSPKAGKTLKYKTRMLTKTNSRVTKMSIIPESINCFSSKSDSNSTSSIPMKAKSFSGSIVSLKPEMIDRNSRIQHLLQASKSFTLSQTSVRIRNEHFNSRSLFNLPTCEQNEYSDLSIKNHEINHAYSESEL